MSEQNHGAILGRSMLVRDIRLEAREADFICSTDAVDSYNTRLDQSSWRLSRFTANPVVLFNHNSSELPIGQAKNLRMEGGKLVATIWFTSTTETAERVWQQVQERTLRGISVGFLPHAAALDENDDVLILSDLELIELSITPTPANHECLAKLRSRAAAPARTGTPPVSTPTTTPQAAERSTQAPTARKDKTMTEEEIKALQARTAELTIKNTDIEARAATLESRAAKAEKELADAQLRAKTLDEQNVRLVVERDAATARATKVEAELIELEVGALVGRKIEPHEKEHYVELRTTNKPLFDKMIGQRKEMALDKPAIPPAGNAGIPAGEQRSAVVSGDNSVAADEFFSDV